MYNWSTDTQELKKDPDAYRAWQLEQMVNFGLGGAKITKDEWRKYRERIMIDPARRKFLELLMDDE